MINCHECGEPMEDEDGDGSSCQPCLDATEEGLEGLKWNAERVAKWEQENPRPGYEK